MAAASGAASAGAEELAARRVQEAAETTRTVGRGFLFILTAKMWFLLTGFAVQFGLPRLLLRTARKMVGVTAVSGPLVEKLATGLYGEYGVATRTVSLINNTMVQGTIQAVSKHVAEDERQAEAVRAAALRVQTVIGLSLALIYFALSDVLAAVLKNGNLGQYFRITAIIIFAYALYAVLIGYLNGRKRFRAQATFDVSYSTLKTCSILGLAFLGYGLNVILGAFSGSALLICLVALLVVGVRNPAGTVFPWRLLFGSMAAIIVYYVLFNALLVADLWVLTGLAGRVASVAPAIAEQLARELVGVYNGVLNVALLPYQAVLAVAFVVFPLISRSTFEQEAQTTQRYIEGTLRYSAILAAGVATAVASTGDGLLRLLKPDFAAGAPALRMYATGEVFFALFAIANTMIIASGRAKVAVGIAAATLAADFAANLLLVPHFLALTAAGDAYDRSGLLAAAGATAPIFALGFFVSATYLRRTFGARLPLLTLLRALVVGGLLVAAGALLQERVPPLLSPLAAAAALGCYLAGLVALRELKRDDLQRLLAVVRRRRRPG